MRRDEVNTRAKFRSGRFVHTTQGWYAMTRERPLGPYPLRALAVQAVNNYLVRGARS